MSYGAGQNAWHSLILNQMIIVLKKGFIFFTQKSLTIFLILPTGMISYLRPTMILFPLRNHMVRPTDFAEAMRMKTLSCSQVSDEYVLMHIFLEAYSHLIPHILRSFCKSHKDFSTQKIVYEITSAWKLEAARSGDIDPKRYPSFQEKSNNWSTSWRSTSISSVELSSSAHKRNSYRP